MTDPTMNAIQIRRFGGPDVLELRQAPVPVPAADEVLVRVMATGLNPPDWYLREGYADLPPEWRPPVEFPIIPGTDISGVIITVGSDVRAFAPGDEIYAMVQFPERLGGSGGYAEYIAVPADQAALKPATLGHTHAAAAPMSLLTAWQHLVELGHDAPNPLQQHPHVPVRLAGQTVVVNGAAGGVGHFAVQIAKMKGARVIAVASGGHEATLRDLGVDQFINYRKTAADTVLRGVDLVVDAVGGPASARFLKTLKPGGALFPIFPLGFNGAVEAEALGVIVSATQVRSNGGQLRALAEHLDSGVIRPMIDSTFPLAEARAAHERAVKGHIRGKIVLTTA